MRYYCRGGGVCISATTCGGVPLYPQPSHYYCGISDSPTFVCSGFFNFHPRLFFSSFLFNHEVMPLSDGLCAKKEIKMRLRTSVRCYT